MGFFRFLNPISIIYPFFCRYCGVFVENDRVFCKECDDSIKKAVSTGFLLDDDYYVPVFAISLYSDPIRSLILRKSFADPLASRQLGCLMYQKTYIREVSVDYIIPIPLHWTRYARRGFNQSYEMAKALGKKMNTPLFFCCARVKRTRFQSKLSYQQRQENLKDAFSYRWGYKGWKKVVKGKNILLVDDLYTTGATLKSFTQFVRQADPKTIKAIVACRVARR